MTCGHFCCCPLRLQHFSIEKQKNIGLPAKWQPVLCRSHQSAVDKAGAGWNDTPSAEMGNHSIYNIIVYTSASGRNAKYTITNRKQDLSNCIPSMGMPQYYPCLCLCLGFSQIILMRPFLLMTLHFSQIGFTEDLTFTAITSFQKVRCPLYHRFPLFASSFFVFLCFIFRGWQLCLH